MSLPENITSPTHNWVVFASAGSGKTSLLINRILRLLTEGVTPDSILAITFTNKAASEIRERLFAVLRSWINLREADLAQALQAIHAISDAEHVNRARCLYEQVLCNNRDIQITTFHAFCQNLLQKFALEADIQPGFQLLEYANETKKEALDLLLKEAKNNPDGKLQDSLECLFTACSSIAAIKNILNEFLDHKSDWWAFVEGIPDNLQYVENKLRAFFQHESQEKFLKSYMDNLKKLFIQLKENMEPLSSEFKNKTILTLKENIEQVSIDVDSLQQLETALFTKEKRPRKIIMSTSALSAENKQLYEQFLKTYHELAGVLYQAIDCQKSLQNYKTNLAWFVIGSRYLDYFQQLKQTRNVLDFDDLEWHAYQLLNNSDLALWIQYKLDQRINHILVDEFQDTNPTQWKLLLPLLEEISNNQQDTKKSLFFVGDTKQSIYQFRRANPELQIQAKNWMETQLVTNTFSTNESQRSAPIIIDFINLIFSEHSSTTSKFTFSSHASARTNLAGHIEIIPLIETQTEIKNKQLCMRNPLEQPRKIFSDSLNYKEGCEIAIRINRLVESEYKIYEKSLHREIQYNDIMILTRNRTHLREIELALQQHNIPYCSFSQELLLEQLEVTDIVSLLKIFDKPYNDLALLQVLRSPLFCFSDEEIMLLAERTEQTWLQRLHASAVNQITSPRFQYTSSYLKKWAKLVNRIPIHDFLDQVYFQLDVINRYKQATQSNLRNFVSNNLHQFLELALDIDSGRYLSLQTFLTKLSYLKNEVLCRTSAQNIEQHSNSVSILTVHSAKGLEAPIVFLADAAASPTAVQAFTANVQWPAYADKPSLMILFSKKENFDKYTQQLYDSYLKEQKEAELNLLYVALTRAKQYLFISGTEPRSKKEDNWYALIKSALEKNDRALPTDWVTKNTSPHQAKVRVKKTEIPNPNAIDPALTQPFPTHSVPEPLERVPNIIPTNESIQAQHIGLITHRLIDVLCHCPQLTDHYLKQHAMRNFRFSIDEQMMETCLEQAKKCVSSPQLHKIFHPDSDAIVLIETPISYVQENKKNICIIDRLIISNQSVWIIDFKTHGTVTRETMAETSVEFLPQIRSYVSAVQQLYPIKTLHASIVYTACQELYNYPSSVLVN